MLLDDAALQPLAYSRQWGEIDAVRTASILSRGASPAVRHALLRQGIAAARGPLRTRGVAELQMRPRVCVPARHGGELWGYLWLLDGSGLDQPAVRRAQAAAETAGRLLAASNRPRTWLRDEASLLSGLWTSDERRREEAALAIAERRLLVDGPYVVVIVTPGGGRPEAVLARAGRRLSAGHAVGAVTAEGVVLLLSVGEPALGSTRADTIAARLLHVLRHGELLEAAAGQSAALDDLAHAREGRRQAAIALRVAGARPPEHRHAAWPTLGADRLLAQLPPDAVADVPPRLAALIREEPALAGTLTAYLDAAGDVPATAKVESLHRSGVYYRLRRIEELTGLDLDRGDDRLLAHVALRTARPS